jgi:hypothetical protein
MSVFVRHEPCPRCGSRDNLARYSDGSAWCFGCGKKERADRVDFVEKAEDDFPVQLDDDLCNDFPRHVVDWLAAYEITVEEALKYGWKYAPQRDQLVFIFRDEEGRPELTQARNFSSTKRKYFTQGPVASILPIFRSPNGGPSLVVVEDILSAAKIARQRDAIPCLGSHMPKSKLKALRLFYDVLAVWLDADKLNEARNIAEQAKWLGFTTRVIYTPLDPQEYSDAEITAQLSFSP